MNGDGYVRIDDEIRKEIGSGDKTDVAGGDKTAVSFSPTRAGAGAADTGGVVITGLVTCSTMLIALLGVCANSEACGLRVRTEGIAEAVGADLSFVARAVARSTMLRVVFEVGAGRSTRGQWGGAFEGALARQTVLGRAACQIAAPTIKGVNRRVAAELATEKKAWGTGFATGALFADLSGLAGNVAVSAISTVGLKVAADPSTEHLPLRAFDVTGPIFAGFRGQARVKARATVVWIR
jgi:hypothetical protein